MSNTKTIYHTRTKQSVNVPAYKLKRLNFGQGANFWIIWNDAALGNKTDIQMLYTMTTRMALERFNHDEMYQMLIGWHNKHDKTINYCGLEQCIKECKAFTADTLKQQWREEKRRYRAKKKFVDGVKNRAAEAKAAKGGDSV